jgi:hypothetical protein
VLQVESRAKERNERVLPVPLSVKSPKSHCHGASEQARNDPSGGGTKWTEDLGDITYGVRRTKAVMSAFSIGGVVDLAQ